MSYGDYDNINALLADLQNSVPGHNVNRQNYNTNQSYGGSSSKQVPQVHSPYQQQQHHYSETQTPPQSNNVSFNDSLTTPSKSFQYQSNQHQHQHQPSPTYSNINSSQRNNSNSGNLSELDSLLQDLSNGRYNGNGTENRKENVVPITYNGHQSGNHSNFSTMDRNSKRPSVDSLLDELTHASSNVVYAQPQQHINGGNQYHGGVPKPGRHVTITVKETKSEKMSGPQGGPVATLEEEITEKKDLYTHAPPNNSPFASSATKELDDLMASLSDFKVNSGSHHHQTVTDYAKPNKGVQHQTIHQTVTETTTYEDEPPHFRHGDQLDSMLGNLQANMSRQGVNTVQKGCCNACEKPIVGQVITALGKTWHPEHFTCNHCSQELGTRNFFERDGFPYCEPDYHSLFSPRCNYCNGAILDKCVTALDKTWHTEHFFCAQCGQQFGEDGFHERDGKPYCKTDYFEMFAPKCNGCNRAIMENYISALNSQWHPDCFVCRDCRQPFQGGSFFDHEGLPYCETHYHAKRGSLCAGCSKPITGRCITAMFRKFHPEHFVCAFCLKQLNKGTFKEQNDKPYCHGCFDKLFG
ncbi:TGFB1I1 family protein [Megaselia abdita]